MTLAGARTYRIYGTAYLWFGALPVAAAFGVFLVYKTATSEDSPGWLFTGFWMTALVWIGFNVLFRFAYAVELGADGLLRFRSPLRERVVRADDVTRVRPIRFSGANAPIVFEHAGGKALLLTPLDGLHELLARLRELNPGVEARRV